VDERLDVIVVKAGGRALTSNMENILNSVAARAKTGVVFVHGGGDIVSDYEKRLGIEPRIVTSPSGIRSRLTDEAELEVYAMVMAGKLGKKISAYLNGRGVKTVNVAGVDSGLIRAQRKKKIVIVDERGRKRIVDGGYTGSITSVDADTVRFFVESGYLLVVTPLALGEEGEMLNIDGDSAASALASGVKADALYLLTDVEGVMLDGRLVNRLTLSEAKAALGRIGPGMNRKVMAAANAVEAGVKKAVIASGLKDDPLLEADRGQATIIET